MYTQAEAIKDCREQLAQVDERIAQALRDRQTAANRGYSASTRRAVEQQLHQLYVLQYDVRKDLARCEAGDLGKIVVPA